jgi:hypothetical protein
VAAAELLSQPRLSCFQLGTLLLFARPLIASTMRTMLFFFFLKGEKLQNILLVADNSQDGVDDSNNGISAFLSAERMKIVPASPGKWRYRRGGEKRMSSERQ